MAKSFHGVFIEEQPTSLVSPVHVDSAMQVVVGTAPVNMGEYETALEPKVIYNYPEAVRKIGMSQELEAFTIMQTVKASFEIYNVAPIIAINVLNPKTHTKSVTSGEVEIEEGMGVIEECGILPDSLVLSGPSGETMVTYELGEDYTAAFSTQTGYVIIEAVSGGRITEGMVLKAAYKQLDPGKVKKADILEGIRKVEEIYPRFNLVPGTLLAPGWSQDVEVYNAMLAQTVGLNDMFRCHLITDIDTDEAPAYDKVNGVKNKNSIRNEMAIAAWPCVRVGDSVYRYSALLGAAMAWTDYQNGGVPYVSPSNKELRISGLCKADGEEIVLDKLQADSLNKIGVVTAINLNGWRVWGNRTAAYPSSTDVKDVFIPCRRMFSWWGNTFVLTYFDKVDEPMNPRLIETIVDSENIRANGYKSRYQLAECYIEYRAEDNPVTDLIDGRIRFKMHLTPYPPAETIICELEFDPYALANALGGE